MRDLKIIGLTGFKGAGKSTVAGIVEREIGAKRISFADPIRDMLRIGLGIQPSDFLPENKEIVIPSLGKSPRYLLQTLGTEWGRKMVGESLWRDLAHRRAITCIRAGVSVVFEDVRFDDEAELVLSMGGYVWEISREGCKGDNHISEKGISLGLISGTIANSDSMGSLNQLVKSLLQMKQEKD